MIRLILCTALLAPILFGEDLRGTWRWNCCRGQHSGTFQITEQNANGSFSGRFGNSPSDGKSPLKGRITNANVQFTRNILPGNQTQSWVARLSVQAGVAKLIDGHWSGYMFSPGNGDFEAERIKAADPDPEPAAGPSIVGRWNWSCCKGAHAGTFIIREQDSQGLIRGVFGNGPSDGATPFEGTYRNGQLSFTRSLTGNLAGQKQQWRARVVGSESSLRTSGGEWSGYSAGPGYTDFQATFIGTR